MELSGCFKKVNSKTFAIPTLTAFAFVLIDTIAVRIGKANTL